MSAKILNHTLIAKKRIALTRKNGSLKYVGQKINISPSQLHVIESGKQINPSLITTLEIMEYYNISIFEIIQKQKGKKLLHQFLGQLVFYNVIDEKIKNDILRHYNFL